MSRCSVASRWPNGFGRSDVIAREISGRRAFCARALDGGQELLEAGECGRFGRRIVPVDLLRDGAGALGWNGS